MTETDARPAAAGAATSVDSHGVFVGREKLLATLVRRSTAPPRAAAASCSCRRARHRQDAPLAELARAGRTRGARWLEGRCYEGEGRPAVLAVDAGAPRARRRRADVGAGRRSRARSPRDVAELLPELRRKLPRLARPATWAPIRRAFASSRASTALLARAAARQPARRGARRSALGRRRLAPPLRFPDAGAAAAPILLIGSYRDVEVRRDRPLALLLGGLAGRPRLDRLELRGLEPSAVAEIVAAVAGGPRPALERRARRADGRQPVLRVRARPADGRRGSSRRGRGARPRRSACRRGSATRSDVGSIGFRRRATRSSGPRPWRVAPSTCGCWRHSLTDATRRVARTLGRGGDRRHRRRGPRTSPVGARSPTRSCTRRSTRSCRCRGG